MIRLIFVLWSRKRPFSRREDDNQVAIERTDIVVAFHLDDQHYAEELKWGVDLEKTTGIKLHALPVPSVFIVDTSGVIRFVYSNPDFRVRLGAQELWKAAAPWRYTPRPASRLSKLRET